MRISLQPQHLRCRFLGDRQTGERLRGGHSAVLVVGSSNRGLDAGFHLEHPLVVTSFVHDPPVITKCDGFPANVVLVDAPAVAPAEATGNL